MNDHMKRALEMKQYIDRAKISRNSRTRFGLAELMAVSEFAKGDFYGAILLALDYGYAKGHRDTKAGVSV